MAIPDDVLAVLDVKFAVLLPHLDERQRRLYLASEAEALGHGGISGSRPPWWCKGRGRTAMGRATINRSLVIGSKGWVEMSQFSVNVCLPPTSPQELHEALDAAMAPFDINASDDWNPDGQWDRWHVNSGDEERFAVRPEYDGDPRLILQATYPNGDPRDRLPLRCDGGPRGLLDFDATRETAVGRARARWHAEQEDFGRLVAEHPPAEPLAAFLERHRGSSGGYPREQAIADHHAQPLVRALNHCSAWDRYPHLGLWVLGPHRDPISRFTRDPQADLEEAAVWVIATFALITLNGQYPQCAWAIERSFGWLMHHRRLARAYKALPARSEAVVHIAMINLMTRRLTGESTPTWRGT